ncbi:hypothetical protein Tco_0750979 [Tanacetum coccineum]|uniref:Uncharacterized protein n=1 Tax=Tanacetum coccineum TaxID=301880 RepID=A0ABQ4Z684_9ASTR
MRTEESLNVTFDESLPKSKFSLSVEDDRINEPVVQDLNGSPSLQVNVSDKCYPKSVKEARGHPIEQDIDLSEMSRVRVEVSRSFAYPIRDNCALRAYLLCDMTYVKGMEVRQHCCFIKMKDRCQCIIQTMVDIILDSTC